MNMDNNLYGFKEDESEKYEKILEEEDAIFEELRSIEDAMKNLKKETGNFKKEIQEEEEKRTYDGVYDRYKIEDMIDGFGEVKVPDIREELNILDELSKDESLGDDELKIIHEEYVEKIEKLYDAVISRKNSVENMMKFFDKIKF